MNDTLTKCPHCGGEVKYFVSIDTFWAACGTTGKKQSELCVERTARQKAEKELAKWKDEFTRCSNSVVQAMDTFPNINEYVAQLEEQLSETRRKLEEVTRFVWGAVHNARPKCGSAMARWACVRNALGVGSTTANELCREHGVDPHEVLKSRCDYSEEAQKGGAS